MEVRRRQNELAKGRWRQRRATRAKDLTRMLDGWCGRVPRQLRKTTVSLRRVIPLSHLRFCRAQLCRTTKWANEHVARCNESSTKMMTFESWTTFPILWLSFTSSVPILRNCSHVYRFTLHSSIVGYNLAIKRTKTKLTRNAWQSLAYSLLGAVVSPPSEYLWKTLTDHLSA